MPWILPIPCRGGRLRHLPFWLECDFTIPLVFVNFRIYGFWAVDHDRRGLPSNLDTPSETALTGKPGFKVNGLILLAAAVCLVPILLLLSFPQPGLFSQTLD